MIKLLYLNKNSCLLLPIFSEYTYLPDNFVSHFHIHKVYHLVFVLDGSGVIEKDTTWVTLRAGDILIINPDEKHVFVTESSHLNYFALNFYLIPIKDDIEEILSNNTEEFIAETKKLEELFNIKSKNSLAEYNSEFFESIKQDITSFKGSLDGYLTGRNQEGYINKCLDFFTNIVSKYFHVEEGFVNPKHCHDIIVKKITEYIDNNLEKKLDLTGLSRDLGYNPTYLSSHFSRKTKMKMTEYHNIKRLEKACLHLKNTRESITDIALALGFSSSQHFSTAFKAYKKVTPRDYRNNIEIG